MTQDIDLKDYLTCLVRDFPTSVAAQLFGYSYDSRTSFKRLLSIYGVSIPETREVALESTTEPHRGIVREITIADGRPTGVERCVVIGDTHHPQHDERAIAAALGCISDLQPQTVILNGDIADMYALSRFAKDPHLSLQLQNEIDSVRDFLGTLRDIVPNSEIIWVEGNHEARFTLFMENIAPQLSGLNTLSVEKLCGCDEFDVKYIPSVGRTAYVEYGPIKVGHFDKVNKFSGYTAKNLMDQYMCSLVQGHTHRLGTHYRTVPGQGEFVAAESGCLCKLDAEYVKDPDWQHGFTVITKIDGSDRFHLQQVPIVDYEALFNDKRYIG